MFRKLIVAAVGAAMAMSVGLPTLAVAQTSQSDGGAGETLLRPEMPSLFYTPQQRRVLEAVRQEVISEETFEEEEFVPLVLQQERLEILTEDEDERARVIGLQGLVRNRRTGASSMWDGSGEAIQFEDGSDILIRDGVEKLKVSDENPNAIEGIDAFNQSRFRLKVGQELAIDGAVGENYPVIIRKSK